MKKILLNNNKSNNKQENQILPPLNKGIINSRAHSGGLSTGISTCNYPPPTLASTQNKNERERAGGRPLADPDWCHPTRGEGFRCSAHGSVTRAFTLSTVEGSPIYISPHIITSKTASQDLGQEQREV
jgi:hypothetical protein